jgi:hypothetical protein
MRDQLVHEFEGHSYTHVMSISVVRRYSGSIATLQPWSGGSVVTFTTFGYCLADNVEVPCSIAVSRLFEGGWKEWSEGRDVEMRGILEMLGWLNVLFWICEGSLPLDNGLC